VQQVGTVNHTPVYPREVIKRALELSATAIDSGAQPSKRRSDAQPRRYRDDQEIARGGQVLLGVAIHDHIIMAKQRPYQLCGCGAIVISNFVIPRASAAVQSRHLGASRHVVDLEPRSRSLALTDDEGNDAMTYHTPHRYGL
jgi:hypothetical protein